MREGKSIAELAEKRCLREAVETSFFFPFSSKRIKLVQSMLAKYHC